MSKTRSCGLNGIYPKNSQDKMGIYSSYPSSGRPNIEPNENNQERIKVCNDLLNGYPMSAQLCNINVILSQLDLIQVNEEQFIKSNKQLRSVIKERDALKDQLEKLEVEWNRLQESLTNQIELNLASSTRRHCNQDSSKRVQFSFPPSEEESVSSSSSKCHHKCKKRRHRERSIQYTSHLYHHYSKHCYGYSSLDGGDKTDSLKSDLPSSPLDHPGHLPSPSQDGKLIIPSWRLHPVSPMSKTDGIENLSDDVFYKRHQKLEIEEKRRKRWDLQRMREERLLKKLKEKKTKQQSKDKKQEVEIFSLFPDIDKIHSIEMNPIVPLTVFGYNLPHFKHEEFSLPWKHRRRSCT